LRRRECLWTPLTAKHTKNDKQGEEDETAVTHAGLSAQKNVNIFTHTPKQTTITNDAISIV